MGCGETEGAIARIVMFMAHHGRVILHDRLGGLMFGTGDLDPLETDLPRPPSQALLTAMRAEGLLDIIVTDTRHGRVAYALTAEGRRAALARPAMPLDSAERVVDIRAGRLMAQVRRRLEAGRRRAEAMQVRFGAQRALVLRMRARGWNTELAEQLLASTLIAIIEMHRHQSLALQFADAARAVPFNRSRRSGQHARSPAAMTERPIPGASISPLPA
jgi:hypothetical protein